MYTAAWAVITVFPALSLSFDKDVSEKAAHLFPNLYTEGQLGQALSRRTFGRWALMGALQSMLVFFLTISAFGTEYMHPRDGAPIDFDPNPNPNPNPNANPNANPSANPNANPNPNPNPNPNQARPSTSTPPG